MVQVPYRYSLGHLEHPCASTEPWNPVSFHDDDWDDLHFLQVLGPSMSILQWGSSVERTLAQCPVDRLGEPEG